MIFLDNVYSCVKDAALLLLNVFIDPWNGNRAFFKSSNGDHVDLSNSLWVLSLDTDEGMSSEDVYGALVQQWTATVDDSRITGGAYVGRLNNVISLRQREGGSLQCPPRWTNSKRQTVLIQLSGLFQDVGKKCSSFSDVFEVYSSECPGWRPQNCFL